MVAMAQANTEGAGQPAHPRSLIRVLGARLKDSTSFRSRVSSD